uniref:Uncharacterized protein n=1 Tax=Rhizophora mucronata TaxID=61149 RepID=A0A2P2QQG6_RHIMU
MKRRVGLHIKCLTCGQKHQKILVRLSGLCGQWEEPGFAHTCGSTILILWTKIF